MDCERIHNDLIFFLDNELPEEKKIIVQNHLAVCNDCRDFLALLKTEMQVIRQEKNPEVSPFFYTRLSARLEKETTNESQSLWTRVAQPAFFSLLLIAGIYSGIKTGSITSASPANQPVVSHIQIIDDFEAEPIESFLLENQ
jgi:predicted anti-sigma-YlaC factor YlaD